MVAENSATLRPLGVWAKNLVDIVDKTHPKHFVRFIENDRLNLTEVGAASLEVIQQASWGGDNNMHALFKTLQLLPHIVAAAERNDSAAGRPFCIRTKGISNLH